MEAFGDEHGLVNAIHATPHKMVMAFAGAGAQALAWLHGVGGSSRTMLAAVDIYSDAAMREWVGFMPARFTSRRVARAMASEAYRRARRYVTANHAQGTVTGATDPVFGLASTATIATDRAKRGDHRVAAAVRDAFGMVTYALTLEKGARDREGEEDVVSLLLLRAVADACGVLEVQALPLTSTEHLQLTFAPSDMLAQVEAGKRELVVVREDGGIVSGARDANATGARVGVADAHAGAGAPVPHSGPSVPHAGPFAIVSGAFHPVHEGHLGLAWVASERTGLPALFELPLVNAEKAPIELLEARRRAHQFAGKGSLALTRSPLFAEKAKLFPGSVFVVGVDTAERILEPRFYDGSFERLVKALEEIEAHGCRFLVAGREGRSGVFRTLDDVKVPEAARAVVERIFEGLPEEAFRQDVSSTEIREGWGDADAAS